MIDLLSQEEAAQVMGVTVQTLINWRKSRGLKFYKVGGSIKYNRQDLSNFAEKGGENESVTLHDSE